MFDASVLLADYSAHAICETVFSAEYTPSMERKKDRFIEFMHASSELMFYRVMRPWFCWDATFYLCSRYDEYHEARNVLGSFVSMMLDSKVDQVQPNAHHFASVPLLGA